MLHLTIPFINVLTSCTTESRKLLRVGIGTKLSCKMEKCLEALAVDNGRTTLIVFLLGDPHLLEGGKRCQDGTSNPDGVLSLGRSNDLDLHGRGCESSDFLLHTVRDTGIHGGATRLYKVSISFIRE